MPTEQRVGGAAQAAAGFELRGRTRTCATLIDVRGKDVLDVGCSFGWFSRYAAEAGAKSVVGVDTSEEALAVACDYAPTASFVRASALDLPFADEHFDVVTMFEVIEHVPQGSELQALREARRVLRTQGRLALSTPGRACFATYTDPAFYLGHRHYRVRDLRRLLEESGFDVLELNTAGGIFDQLDLLLYYASRHLARREQHPVEFIRSRGEAEWQVRRGNNTILVVAGCTPRAGKDRT